MTVEDLELESKKLDREKATRRNKRNNIFIALGVIFLVLGIAGLAIACGMYYATLLAKTQYGIVFDAGSSHTSMYLYEWDGAKVNGTGKVKELSSCDVDGDGLTDFADNPTEAGSSLTACLDEATNSMSAAIKPFSPVYLGATAGMRLLNLTNPTAVDQIIQSVQDEVENSGFEIRDIDEQVKILDGKDEGTGLWVTANYVAGTLNIALNPGWTPLLPSGVDDTIGVLDLGGGSTQVSYALTAKTSAPMDDTDKLTLYSEELTVFSESYLCFGAKEMRNQVLAILTKDAGYEGQVEHPCFVAGYEANMSYTKVFKSVCTESYRDDSKKESMVTVLGTGNNTQCELVMTRLFAISPYYTGFTGKLPERLVARGAFAYAVADLTRPNSTEQLEYTTFVELMNDWCSTSHSVIKEIDVYDPNTVCVNAHYIHKLLKDIYKIPEDKWTSIWFINKLNDVSLGWSLGYMTNITSALPHAKLDLYYISTPVFIIVVVITAALIVLGIGAIILACQSKRTHYQSLQRGDMAQPF